MVLVSFVSSHWRQQLSGIDYHEARSSRDQEKERFSGTAFKIPHSASIEQRRWCGLHLCGHVNNCGAVETQVRGS